jgi:hypothetical protein
MLISKKKYEALEHTLKEHADALQDERNLRVDAETQINDLKRDMATLRNAHAAVLCNNDRIKLQARELCGQAAEALVNVGNLAEKTQERIEVALKLLPDDEPGPGKVTVDTIQASLLLAQDELSTLMEARTTGLRLQGELE